MSPTLEKKYKRQDPQEESLVLAFLEDPTLCIAGIDEVGVGCWAGPVIACAVIFKREIPQTLVDSLMDSKKLSAKKRTAIAAELQSYVYYNFGLATVEEIDRINIYQATKQAMYRAFIGLSQSTDRVYIDGRIHLQLACPSHAIIKGDTKIKQISAASILAKVHRDTLMQTLSQEYPAYHWHRNVGYGTKEHLKALENTGVTPHHRQSYAPIKKLLSQKKLLAL